MQILQDSTLARKLQNAFLSVEIHKAAETEHKSRKYFNDVLHKTRPKKKTRCSLGISCSVCGMAGTCVRAM